MGYTYSYEVVKENLEKAGYYLDVTKEEYKGVTLTPLYVHDKDGYKYKAIYDVVLRNPSHKIDRIGKSNPFTIDNINKFLKDNDIKFICISDAYYSETNELQFRCLNCGEIVTTTWKKMHASDPKRTHIVCPNCGKRTESLHASVLKQLFMHEYPDTVVEDKSYRNPNTGRICPTDIVNHNRKIAIEIQSQWHDFKDIKIKDGLKKQFWLDKGYEFYDPDIRDYSVLEMCQLFFDIDELPDYIDYHYSDCINAKQIQMLLDQGKSITEIVEITNVSRHRIHDAHASGKITYPDFYTNVVSKPVTKYDKNKKFIAHYRTIADAARSVDGHPSNLQKILLCGDHMYKNYYFEYRKP